MRIKKVNLHNFRIYKDVVSIDLSSKNDGNISIIAGKNGFGKTTFLTSLIWCFYGKLMAQVEDKYKKDIKNLGGYENYIKSLLSRDVLDTGMNKSFAVEIILEDLLIPSIPCKTLSVTRSYNFGDKKESLRILIDGDENELTKEVGFEVFINDFILPREIAKFFFFDAEKIVSLAEAKTKSELRSLSKAYSEVLGIKKYEELKHNLESLLTKLRRRGVSGQQELKLNDLVVQDEELQKLVRHNEEKLLDLDKQIEEQKIKSDSLQEKLIREGNSMTLAELKELKNKKEKLTNESKEFKQKLKKLLDLAPLVIAGKHLKKLYDQLLKEQKLSDNNIPKERLQSELKAFSKQILAHKQLVDLDSMIKSKIELVLESTLKDKIEAKETLKTNDKIYLDFSKESFREFEALYSNIKTSYLSQFNDLVKKEKTNKALLNRTVQKIKQGEARKDNHLAKELRLEKKEVEQKLDLLIIEKGALIERLSSLKVQLASHKKVLSEYEKNFNLAETDKKKYAVTTALLDKINKLIVRIKEEKKYSLQKSVSLGLKKLMHKEDFIRDVRVNIADDVMDIDLLDINGKVIDKDSLSKGEQQLYATALLKALVDESGFKFPVFIDSPLQKFDKFHSKNMIKQFYPSISDQVVLFPLLEKELSEAEFELLNPFINKTFLIHNELRASKIKELPMNELFTEFKKEKDVYAH